MVKEYTWIDESRTETYTDTGDNRQLTIKQEVLKQICHMLFIEVLVCGLNLLSGNEYNTGTWIAIFLSVIIIYIVVYAVMYINDQKSAEEFNERLREYQKNAKQH